MAKRAQPPKPRGRKKSERPIWHRKDLLGLEDVTREEIQLLLDTARSFREILDRPIKKVPTLRGKTVVNFFFEPSTRTRTSFEIAGKWLSADVINISAGGSSLLKGETLLDTVANIEAMKVDLVTMRHSASGAPHFIASRTHTPVVNAGDGAHEHPTQALLDLMTIRDSVGKIDGLRITILGDVLHSRVARSDIWGMTRMGASVTVCGPRSLMPAEIDQMGVRVSYNLEEAISDADIVYVLRIQKERQEGQFIPSLREYVRLYRLDFKRLAGAPKDAIVMHAGPVNRDIELASDLADSSRSVILDQVTNGVAARMAVLYLLITGGRDGSGN